MGLIPLPRRHRMWWLLAAVLAVAAWGSWLAATGRTPDYSNGTWGTASPTSQSPAASGVPISSERADMTSRPATTSAPSVLTESVAGASTSPQDLTHVLAPEPRSFASMTDPVAFARAISDVVLSYKPDTNFEQRNTAVLAVAALPPLGSPAELAGDLEAFTPHDSENQADRTVTFAADSVASSSWASARFPPLGLPEGVFAIDVVGTQTITAPGESPLSASVTLGITGACPPALTQCEIDRIFPKTVQQALAS